MSREELRELVTAMSWAALDLAQHLSWLNEVVIENPNEGYVRAQAMAYALSAQPFEGTPPPQVDVVIYDETGLHREEF